MTAIARNITASPKDGTASSEDQVLDSIVKALSGLRFGSVEIVVHESRVTQIERKEKFRFGG